MSGEERDSKLKDVVRKGGSLSYTNIVNGGVEAGLSKGQTKRGITSLVGIGELILMDGLYDLAENKEQLKEKVRETGAFVGLENPLNVRELAKKVGNKNSSNSASSIIELKNIVFEKLKATEIVKTEKYKEAQELHRKQIINNLVREGYTLEDAERIYEDYIPKIRQPDKKNEQDMKIEAENVVKRIMAGTISTDRIAEALTVRDECGAYDFNFG
ncbi:Uncharacterised protein [uncultured archaeon]|nr:Uncharacterised protein [uncultured archaeon]